MTFLVSNEARGIPPVVSFDVFPEQAPVEGYFEALRAAIREMAARQGLDWQAPPGNLGGQPALRRRPTSRLTAVAQTATEPG